MGRTSVSPAQGANASSNSSNIAQRLACHTKITIAISEALYALCIADLYQCPENEDQTESTHYCSMRHPCVLAQHALHPILVNFRLVCKFWDWIIVHEVEDRFLQPQPEIEAVYYPYTWHINTKVRRAILHGQFRVFRTIDTEGGNSGVFRAYNYRSDISQGCRSPSQAIVKAWADEDDQERQTEERAYTILTDACANDLAIPRLLAKGWDKDHTLFSLVLEDVGASLDTLMSSVGPLNERAIAGLAIQLIDCYAKIHRLGIIHNGVKPGNICLSATTNKIYLIDFGLSYFLDIDKLPFRGTGIDNSKENLHILFGRNSGQIVGNRLFLSVLGQYGMLQSQRDDLESLGYLFSYLRHGRLPWNHKDDNIWQLKMATPASVLFENMDVCFLKYWKDVKSLAFGEMADYEMLKGHFSECWKRNCFAGSPGEVNWALDDLSGIN
ncbi:hypothetical protein D9619_012086 [Psilocybe cf. subviscida]|uniref:Protein kinase domain-containing protein n=1 Tax=Psilocybe cf. subviscida TaxID=2480587 RepID=A0A8H5B7L5_9AGAR|nr:hypothetical protein D9619_012086 [Psilocybe cf. subviscida]